MIWPILNLKDVAFFQEGPGIRNWQFRNNGIKLVNVKNIVNGFLNLENSEKHLDIDEVNQKYKHFLVDAGDILMASSGATWGKIAWVENEHLPLCMNTSMIRFNTIDAKVLNVNYLFHFLNSNEFRKQMNKLITGSAQPNFGSSHLKQIKISLPPLTEQKRIAAILDKADSIRRKRQQAIKLADEFLRAAFLEMFGDPISNPKGWEVRKLKEISTSIFSGSTPIGGKENYVEKGFVFLRSQNVWKRKINLEDVAYIDEETHRKMKKSSLKHRDILMTKTGRFNTENSSLGRAAMFLGEDDSANVNGHVYSIRLKPNLSNEFVLYILTTNEYRDYIRGVCVGGIDKRQLNKEHLEEFPIIFPPPKMQQEFAKIMSSLEKQKERAGRSLLASEKLFNSLSQKAFSGQL